jgi:WD40 repeat protein
LILINERKEFEAWDVARIQKAYSFGRGEMGESSGTELALSRTITVWDTDAKKLLLALPDEQSQALAMAWSPNRKLLAIGSMDGGIGIWNIPQVRAQLAEIGLDW